MAQVKMLTRRCMILAALLGASAATVVGAGAAADGCYWLGSMTVRR